MEVLLILLNANSNHLWERCWLQIRETSGNKLVYGSNQIWICFEQLQRCWNVPTIWFPLFPHAWLSPQINQDKTQLNWATNDKSICSNDYLIQKISTTSSSESRALSFRSFLNELFFVNSISFRCRLSALPEARDSLKQIVFLCVKFPGVKSRKTIEEK